MMDSEQLAERPKRSRTLFSAHLDKYTDLKIHWGEAERTGSHPGAEAHFGLRIQEAIDACQSGPGCLDATHAPPQRPSHAKCAGLYPAHLIHRERACFSGDASCRQTNTPPTESPGLVSADLIDGTLLRKMRRRDLRLGQHHHLRSNLHATVEISDVVICHANTSRRHRRADGIRLVGSMDAVKT